MDTTNQAIVVLTTVPDQNTAQTLAKQLLSQKLAACVNIMPQLHSIYHWQEQIVSETECLVLIKTIQSCYPQLAQMIEQHHPYDIPELIALPIIAGSENYLAWIHSVL